MNTYELLMEHAEKVGWNNDSKIRVLCDFLDDIDELDTFAALDAYLQERVKEEQKYGHLLRSSKR